MVIVRFVKDTCVSSIEVGKGNGLFGSGRSFTLRSIKWRKCYGRRSSTNRKRIQWKIVIDRKGIGMKIIAML